MKLLVTGNIGYITTEFIKEAFPECQILLLGETALKYYIIIKEIRIHDCCILPVRRVCMKKRPERH